MPGVVEEVLQEGVGGLRRVVGERRAAEVDDVRPAASEQRPQRVAVLGEHGAVVVEQLDHRPRDEVDDVDAGREERGVERVLRDERLVLERHERDGLAALGDAGAVDVEDAADAAAAALDDEMERVGAVARVAVEDADPRLAAGRAGRGERREVRRAGHAADERREALGDRAQVALLGRQPVGHGVDVDAAVDLDRPALAGREAAGALVAVELERELEEVRRACRAAGSCA